MLIKGSQYRTIWLHPNDAQCICIIDQRYLPHQVNIREIRTVDEMCLAIRDMWVRGAPLIGAAAAWGMYLASFEVKDANERDATFKKAYDALMQTRPTAVNLRWALEEMLDAITGNDSVEESRWYAKVRAQWICDADVENNTLIGEHGMQLIKEIAARKNGETVQVLTHCNAGWLATVDRGTATAPIYAAKEAGIDIHVYVSETRPRNQGAQLTAWELGENNIPYTLIADNASGYFIQKGMVDLVITGSDRTSAQGDVINKIGTYMKALAAYDNHVPFYVALPLSTIDMRMEDAEAEAVIEERNPDEIKYVQGALGNAIEKVLISPVDAVALNYAFDITPARYVTGLITEKGICSADKPSISALFNTK